jgi:hypothetical protein
MTDSQVEEYLRQNTGLSAGDINSIISNRIPDSEITSMAKQLMDTQSHWYNGIGIGNSKQDTIDAINNGDTLNVMQTVGANGVKLKTPVEVPTDTSLMTPDEKKRIIAAIQSL